MTPERQSLRNDIDVMSDGRRTAFMKLDFVYPECKVLLDRNDKLYPLQCLRTSCPKNQACMDVLARRVKYLFDNVVPSAGLLILYYTWIDHPSKIRAGVFFPDFREPRQITCRRAMFTRYKNEGDVFAWEPTKEFYLLGSERNIIPVSSLLHD